MYSTPNMNLIVWDQDEDDYAHTQLAADWNTIDLHDHSNGLGVQINTPGIADGAITSSKLAAGAVTNAALAANSVSTADIQDGAVTGSKIASGAITGSDIAAGAIGYTQLDPNVVPLGTVMTWYRAAGMTNTPGGNWEIMDGRTWSSISNTMGASGAPLTTGNIPDMRSKFSQGAATSPSGGQIGIGASGGSATLNLTHGHIVDNHFHTVGAHTHPISVDGNHSHTFMGGLGVWSRTNAFNLGFQTAYYPFTVTTGGPQGVWANTFYTMYIKNLGSVPGFDNTHGSTGAGATWYDAATPMDEAGPHNHGGATGGNNGFTTGSSGAFTDTQLGVENIEPPYVGLLYIMRVR